MNRWLQVAIPIVAMAVVGAVGAMVPAESAPTAAGELPAGQVSAACPAFSEPTAKSTVAVTGTGPVRVGPVGGDQTEVPAGRVVTSTGAGAVRLTGLTTSAPSGTSLVTAASGPSRGLMLAGCVTPTTESWLVGVRSDQQHVTQVVLVNLDQDASAVDLTIFGPDGQVLAAGSRGILVAPNSQRVVPLGPLVQASGPIAVRIQASSGRIAAVGREVMWRGVGAVGTDWAPVSETGTTAVLPVVPGGAGARELVVTNPGDRSIRVGIDALAAQGPVGLVGAETLEVPARSTRSTTLQAGLRGEAAAVRVRSDSPFAAGLRVMTAEPGPASDLAFSGAGTALLAVTTIPLPLSAGLKAQLSLANAGEESASAVVSFTNARGETVGKSVAVRVVPGGSGQVDVPAGAVAIRVEMTAGALHGGVSVSAQLGRVSVLGSYAVARTGRGSSPVISFDPHVTRA